MVKRIALAVALCVFLAAPLVAQGGPFNAQLEAFWRLVSTGGRTFASLKATNLTVTGTCTGCGGGTPGGSTTQVQFNDAGSFAGDSQFVWKKTTHGLGLGAGGTAALADSAVSFYLGPDPTTVTSQFALAWENQFVVKDSANGLALFLGAQDTTGNNRATALSASALTSADFNEARTVAVDGYSSGNGGTVTGIQIQLHNLSAISTQFGTGITIRTPQDVGGGWNTLTALGIDDQGGANFAIQTGTGKVVFGDVVSATNFKVGSTSIVPLRGVTGSIGGSLLAAGACTGGNATVTGATTGMVAAASPVADPDPGLSTGVVWDAFVSSSNTVTVRVCGLAAVTPNATTYQVSVQP